MQPFNLQEALAGKAVKLRNGDKAFVRYHETQLSVRLIGFRADGYIMVWCVNGDYYPLDAPSDHDIIGMYSENRIINGFEVPAPEAKGLERGTRYYLVSPTRSCFHSCECWFGDTKDKYWLERGLVFLNREDATANTKAMLGIDPNSEDESW